MRQQAASVRRVTGVGPSSFILHQWEDELVDAYDRLKAQICQCEEIIGAFFSGKIRLAHRIQKDQASHRLMWEAGLTLTQARERFFKFCEMQMHFTIKC